MEFFLYQISRKALVNFFKPVEYSLESLHSDEDVRTVWIIGPPRSGTTLLYKLLLEQFSFAYISNFIARFYEIPIIAQYCLEKFYKDELERSKKFNYGQTKGLRGPHEAGKFWYQWFPNGNNIYVPENNWDSKSLKSFRRVIQSFCHYNGFPGLFKNTYNSMRIAPIIEAFPNALFLICKRDPVDVAQSILNSRIQIKQDKKAWWALPPKEYDEIKNHPYWDQVVEQVYYIYKQIETDRKRIGSGNFYSVSYRNLCLKTKQELKNIYEFFLSKQLTINKKDEEVLCDTIKYSTGQKVNDEDYRKIKSKVRELW